MPNRGLKERSGNGEFSQPEARLVPVLSTAAPIVASVARVVFNISDSKYRLRIFVAGAVKNSRKVPISPLIFRTWQLRFQMARMASNRLLQ